MDQRCEFPMGETQGRDDFPTCGSKVGMCTENLCDYHCKHECGCGGWSLEKPKEETV